MANIKPFKGYRYNVEKVGSMSNVVCPSYYKLNDQKRAALYNVSEYNAVRIFSGEEKSTDNEINNKFTRAGDDLRRWIAEGVIKKEEKPAVYLYEQTVEVYGTTYTNTNLITLAELEELNTGSIHPCEEMHETSLRDYYEYISHTKADTSMISCLYVEKDKELLNLMNEIRETEPDFEFNTLEDDSVHEKVWIITYEPTIKFIAEQFKDIPLYITDGQTRYEACLRYRNYMKANNPAHTGEEPYNYTLVSLMNTDSDGLVILPFHRQVKCPRGFKEDYFIAAVQDHFKIEKIIVDNDEEEILDTIKKQISTTRKETKIGVYCGGDYFYRLMLTDKDYIKNNLLPQMSKAYCSVDTVVLNKLILEDLLNVTDETYSERVKEERSRHQCFKHIEDGEFEVVFMLNAVKIDQIKAVTAVGERLPHMTISIFPKPSVGTIINVFEN
ncbi:MAG: DUF1015 domain-containing protein [Firmicutes bacterium]|nr:DUF1015 domain-containing protein [Bacillota bacterium]